MLGFLTTDTIDPESPLALVLLMMSSSAIFVMGLIPLSIAFAIQRYRLWDVDIIIRRTLVYSLLTIALGLIYLGVIVFLQNLLGGLTGERQPEIVTVISTLTIAALFTPLRRRIQSFIDRRFYRRKYNAEKLVLAFSTSLREEVDLNELTHSLVK
jgi:hypothetical protein